MHTPMSTLIKVRKDSSDAWLRVLPHTVMAMQVSNSTHDTADWSLIL